MKREGHPYMKILLFAARILWALAIPVFVISTTVNVITTSMDLYRYDFARYRISDVTHISNAQLEDAARMWIKYLNGQSDTPQLTVSKNGKDAPLYNSKEITHLADVRKITDLFRLLQGVSIVLLLAAGLLLYFKDDVTRLITGLRNGAVISLAFTGILVVWALVDFDGLFYMFHVLSFSNDLWILDPRTDYLIMMFPESFFNDAAMLVVSSIIVESVLLLAAGLVLQRIIGKNPPQAA
jgi:integral membrane protein (TIGR01906 family)